jgi:hypothetical protein
MDSVRRRATGRRGLRVVRAAHPVGSGAGAVRYRAGLACTGRAAESGARGKAAMEQSADPVGDDVGRVGPDAGDQRCPVVASSEGVEGGPAGGEETRKPLKSVQLVWGGVLGGCRIPCDFQGCGF